MAKNGTEKSERSQTPVFSIDGKDPFIEGVIRFYFRQAETKKNASQAGDRPFILEADDPAFAATLENYILRAKGAGDIGRASEAEKIRKLSEQGNRQSK